ncbi:MAG: carbohydrate binding domain-containing protein, partial [Clostridia bacterium]|nr:carbohydrate binding domain-containing protein [Clostridia bacterium]
MKKSCFKKVAALLTAVVMLAAVLAVPASAAQVVNTELLNRGFVKAEKVLDYKGREAPAGWQRAEGNVVDFEAAADANGVVIDGTALKLDFNANLANNISNYRSDYNWFGYYQNVKVEKYTEYTFSFWVLRNAPATSAVALGQVKAYDGDDTNLVKLEAKKTTGGWEYLSGTFNSGNNDAVTVQLFAYAAGVDSTDMVVYFDYVSLQKGATVPPEAETPENLIANGDMELFNDVGTPFERLDTREAQHWSYDGANFNGVVKPYERISGVNGYGLTATNRLSWLGQIYQTVTLEANTDYSFSFYEKSNSTDAVMFGYVIPETGSNNDTNALIKLEKGISSVDTWQKLSGTFNSGDVTSARVVLRYYKRGATTNDTIDENCHFSFDEMVLAKQEKAIVANGDMELFNDVGTPFERLDTAAAQHWHYDSGNFNGVVKPYDRTNGVTGYGLTA